MNEVILRQAALDEQEFPSLKNKDITKVLEGGNDLKVVYLPKGLFDKNSDGEMIDPWGSAILFVRQGSQILAKQPASHPDR